MLKEGFYFWRSRKPQELFEGLPASIGMITSPAKWSSRGSVRSCCWLAVRQHEEPKAHRITTARGSGSHITPDSHSGRAPRLQESSCLESWRGFLQCTHCLQDGSIRPRLAVRINRQRISDSDSGQGFLTALRTIPAGKVFVLFGASGAARAIAVETTARRGGLYHS